VSSGWQSYGIASLAVLALAGLVLAGRYVGFDAQMWLGIGAGGALGALTMGLSLLSLRKALKQLEKAAALGQVLGGFFLRMVLVVAGTLVFAWTGWASPIGFALSFLMTVFLYLSIEVHLVQKALDAPRPAGPENPA
jgi:hypothetical protein